jgi:hypothetical protein
VSGRQVPCWVASCPKTGVQMARDWIGRMTFISQGQHTPAQAWRTQPQCQEQNSGPELIVLALNLLLGCMTSWQSLTRYTQEAGGLTSVPWGHAVLLLVAPNLAWPLHTEQELRVMKLSQLLCTEGANKYTGAQMPCHSSKATKLVKNRAGKPGHDGVCL